MGEKTGEYIYEIVKDSDGVYCYIKQGEVVRCKDCKNYRRIIYNIGNDVYTSCYCKDTDMNVEKDDYCSRGIRKEKTSGEE